MKMDSRKKYQNLAKQYSCKNCGEKITAPMHCSHPMHIAEMNDQQEWNCWMGPNCGKSTLISNCPNPSLTPI